MSKLQERLKTYTWIAFSILLFLVVFNISKVPSVNNFNKFHPIWMIVISSLVGAVWGMICSKFEQWMWKENK